MTRVRAIFCALLYGILPWQLYEPTPHYDCGYWKHLRQNLAYAWVWLTFAEDASDYEFEATTQGRVPLEPCKSQDPLP